MLPIRIRKNKYNAHPTTVGGVRFHSKKEAMFYLQLKSKQLSGEIDFILMQVPFRLPGDTIYRMDFVTYKKVHNSSSLFHEASWDIKFYEVKGRKLALGDLKVRQTQELYGINIQIV